MAPRLSELFQAAQGGPIEWGGQTVRMMYDLADLGPASTLTVKFLSVSKKRPQALRLTAKGGQFKVNDQTLEDVVLWSDSAPETVEIRLRPPKGGTMTARIWNAWRDPSDAMQAWIGDAGIVVDEPGPGSVLLRCSDGFDTPSFDDLVVELRVTQDQ
jgi:hypothetical protein